MTIGCCGKCSQYVLVMLNVIFMIVGVGLIGLGIFMRVDLRLEYFLEHFHGLDITKDDLHMVAYVTIGVGVFTFLVATFGCCGAYLEKISILIAYIVLIIIVICAEVAVGIYTAVQLHNIDEIVRKKLHHEISHYRDSGNLTVDFLQAEFHCCGIDSFQDYRTSTWFLNKRNASKTGEIVMFVPNSCCIMNREHMPKNKEMCQKEAASTDMTVAHDLHKQGCYTKLLHIIDAEKPILIGVGVGVMFIQAMGIILAVVLRRNIKLQDLYDWY